jgi:hypothetical protein
VASTAIRHVFYDRSAAALDVTFTSGRRYRYRDVPADVAGQLQAAPSQGAAFNALVRDRFRFEEVPTWRRTYG